jgi:transketolase
MSVKTSVKMDEINTRMAFGAALAEYAKTDDSVFAIGADTTKSMGFNALEKLDPNRVLNNGIAEQNMMLLASGMAACGAKVFVATYAPFASMRMLEQIRTFCAYPDLDIKIISGLSGLSGGIEGVTHQGLEDISIMRSISNMTVFCPADAAATKVITKRICEYKGPVYLRIGRNPVPTVFGDDYTFEIGKANFMKEDGYDATIISTGFAVHRAMLAEEILRANGYNVKLIDMPCIKPIDKEAIVYAAKETGAILTVEENNVLGGLGGAVAEVLGESCPVLLYRVGIDDLYTESAPHDLLMDRYNLSPDHIASETMRLINAKKHLNR